MRYRQTPYYAELAPYLMDWDAWEIPIEAEDNHNPDDYIDDCDDPAREDDDA